MLYQRLGMQPPQQGPQQGAFGYGGGAMNFGQQMPMMMPQNFGQQGPTMPPQAGPPQMPQGRFGQPSFQPQGQPPMRPQPPPFMGPSLMPGQQGPR
jgi:hypothetical protein